MSDLLDRKLVSAAWGGNYIKVRELLEAGAGINGAANGQTALQAAVRQGHDAVADFLIEKGANVNETAPHGKTLLMEMVERGNLSMVRLLLSANHVDLNRTDPRYGNTALMKAVISGDADIVRRLVNGGADVTIANKAGMTPMEWARRWGREEILKYIQYGLADEKIPEAPQSRPNRSKSNRQPERGTRRGAHKTSDIFAITGVDEVSGATPAHGRSRLHVLDEGEPDLFSKKEWDRIFRYMETESENLGLPGRRGNSLVIGSFNLRNADPRRKGLRAERSDPAWEFISMVCKRFDLLAIQEIKDSLGSLRRLKRRMGEEFSYLVSDITGNLAADDGNTRERLAFLFFEPRVKHTRLASEITIDRTRILEFLNKKENRTAPNKDKKDWSDFIDFLRTPFCASFEISDSSTMSPYHFLAVNCHLAPRDQGDQRRLEFMALVQWLISRAKLSKRMYHPNFLVMGDFNLDYDRPNSGRPRIDQLIRENTLDVDITVNFPFLDEGLHEKQAPKTNIRENQPYDHIGFIGADARIPGLDQNSMAGNGDPDNFDYGIFDFAELISRALLDQSYSGLHKKTKGIIDRKLEHEISDHLPVWIRLPMPD